MKIVSDSSSNLTALEDVKFASVSIRVLTDSKEYSEDSQEGVLQMIEELAAYKGRSQTSCPAPGDWLEAFADEDEIFVITISSGVSGSYNSAMVAKQQYEDENPGKKVFVIDTLSTGPEMALIIQKLRALILEGKDYAAICEEIMEYRQKTMLLFSLESLTNLANNGRISPAIAKLFGLVGLRFVGRASVDGILQQTDKCRGEKRTLAALYQNMIKFGYAGGKVIIDHCCNENAAMELMKMLHAKFPDANITIGTNKTLCSFYAEKGGLLVGYELNERKPA